MVCLILLSYLPPPLQISTKSVCTCLHWRQAEEEGPSSGGVCAGRGRRGVEVMRVAPLCVWRRWAAFIVLFCWQVLASGCGRWGHRLWVIVQVTSVALGCCHWGHSPAGSIVTVTNICAAGCGGGCKVPVTIWPVAGIGRKSRVSFIKKWFSLSKYRGIRCKLHTEDNKLLQFKFAQTRTQFSMANWK